MLNGEMVRWAVLCAWLVVNFSCPTNKKYKGHFWRTFRRLPGCRKVASKPGGDSLLWLGWFFGLFIIVVLAGIPVMWVYLLDMVRIVDDWLNADDDDYRKKWERLKNKVRWRTFKPAPVKARG